MFKLRVRYKGYLCLYALKGEGNQSFRKNLILNLSFVYYFLHNIKLVKNKVI